MGPRWIKSVFSRGCFKSSSSSSVLAKTECDAAADPDCNKGIASGSETRNPNDPQTPKDPQHQHQQQGNPSSDAKPELKDLRLLLAELPQDAEEQLISFLSCTIPQPDKVGGIEKTEASNRKPNFLEKPWFWAKELLNSAKDNKDLAKILAEVLKEVGASNWMLIGLLCLGLALDSLVSISSTEKKCITLLSLMHDATKTLRNLKQHYPEDSSGLKQVLVIIMENSLLCLDYINGGSISKFLKAKTMEKQISDAHQMLQSVFGQLNLEGNEQILKIIKESFCYYSPIEKLLDFSPVGLEKKREDVINLLNMNGKEDQVVAAIIWGLGGMGKSTLAFHSVDYISSQFAADLKYSRVIFDNTIHEGRHSHITKLQQQIVNNLTGVKVKIANPDDGKIRLKQELEKVSCFLLIDNVNDVGDIQLLLPREICPQPGIMVRLLITSRTRDIMSEVPRNCQAKEYQIHNLSFEDAILLLKTTVMGSNKDESRFLEEMEKLEEISESCSGVPLLLYLIGKQLKDSRDKSQYDEIIAQVKKGDLHLKFGYEKIKDILLFVYHNLSPELRTTFLDICNFFLLSRQIWSKWHEVSMVLGERQLDTLVKKGLVKKDKDNIVIHDVLMSMSAQPDTYVFQSFLEEDSKQAAEVALDYPKVSRETKAFRVHCAMGSKKNCCLKSKYLDEMHPSLRILDLAHASVTGQCQATFEELRLLRLRSVKCQGLLFNFSRNFRNLRYIDIQFSELAELPPGFCSLPCITKLSIHFCQQLKELPYGFGRLTCLKELAINYCLSLNSLPEDIGGLKALRTLHIHGAAITKLPESFFNLKSLETCFLEATQIQELPGGPWDSLISLRNLSLVWSGAKVNSLPEEIFSMTQLEALRIEGTDVTALPSEIGKMNGLRSLHLVSNRKLQSLPESIVQLTSLEKLSLMHCRGLRECELHKIMELKSLKALSLAGSPDLNEGRQHLLDQGIYLPPSSRLQRLFDQRIYRPRQLPSESECQERLRVAILVSKAASQFIEGDLSSAGLD